MKPERVFVPVGIHGIIKTDVSFYPQNQIILLIGQIAHMYLQK
jgi:hypothetical protein